MQFSIKKDDLELQSCGDILLLSGEHNTARVVKWERKDEDQYCYVLAYWEEGKEGYDLHFVGTRPFANDVSPSIFMSLAKTGQSLLDAVFEEARD
jgi:hypothetical protein